MISLFKKSGIIPAIKEASIIEIETVAKNIPMKEYIFGERQENIHTEHSINKTYLGQSARVEVGIYFFEELPHNLFIEYKSSNNDKQIVILMEKGMGLVKKGEGLNPIDNTLQSARNLITKHWFMGLLINGCFSSSDDKLAVRKEFVESIIYKTWSGAILKQGNKIVGLG